MTWVLYQCYFGGQSPKRFLANFEVEGEFSGNLTLAINMWAPCLSSTATIPRQETHCKGKGQVENTGMSCMPRQFMQIPGTHHTVTVVSLWGGVPPRQDTTCTQPHQA